MNCRLNFSLIKNLIIFLQYLIAGDSPSRPRPRGSGNAEIPDPWNCRRGRGFEHPSHSWQSKRLKSAIILTNKTKLFFKCFSIFFLQFLYIHWFNKLPSYFCSVLVFINFKKGRFIYHNNFFEDMKTHTLLIILTQILLGESHFQIWDIHKRYWWANQPKVIKFAQSALTDI